MLLYISSTIRHSVFETIINDSLVMHKERKANQMESSSSISAVDKWKVKTRYHNAFDPDKWQEKGRNAK